MSGICYKLVRPSYLHLLGCQNVFLYINITLLRKYLQIKTGLDKNS